MSVAPPSLTVVIHRALDAWQPEIEYVLRTFASIAGCGCRISWTAAPDGAADVYYGPPVTGITPSVWIPACGRAFTDAPSIAARSVVGMDSGARLELDGIRVDARGVQSALTFDDDIVFAAYWLLTGAREPFLKKSRVGNLDLEDSPLVRDGVLDLPFVSIWGAAIRRHFQAQGWEMRRMPWAADGRAAFAFTHDVDYPQIIPWIEAPRLLLQKRPGLAWKTALGRNSYWTFDEWVSFEGQFGARPCFYFMARQGSLLQYALGTPDDFYDVRTEPFRRLFGTLREAGAEIGLHASFNAYRDAATMRAEIDRIRTASSGPVHGNRHHYWHLDPDDPNTTLARHAEAGLEYDTSLGLELYPGFRRGICHPFRPFHPVLRRTIDTIQLPPAWMDDHFDRRLAHNRIADSDDAARRLVAVAAQTGGVVVVDYHSRGMNRETYPRYGAWLQRFAERELPGRVDFHLPHELAALFRTYEGQLQL